MRITFNKSGFEDLLTSGPVKAMVEREAEALAARANAIASTTDPEATDPYYEVQDGTTNRARFRVKTASGEQFVRNVRHEARTQALQKGL